MDSKVRLENLLSLRFFNMGIFPKIFSLNYRNPLAKDHQITPPINVRGFRFLQLTPEEPVGAFQIKGCWEEFLYRVCVWLYGEIRKWEPASDLTTIKKPRAVQQMNTSGILGKNNSLLREEQSMAQDSWFRKQK